jgi:hypothetical protein
LWQFKKRYLLAGHYFYNRFLSQAPPRRSLPLRAMCFPTKADSPGIYLILKAEDKADADRTLSTLPYYPYMKTEMMALR